MTETVMANGHDVPAVPFRAALKVWGQSHFRPYPWRGTANPYRLLLAEVMLHRTQARQVVPVYERFVARYPELPALVAASRDDLAIALAPLGLHWRVPLVYEMAIALVGRFNGAIPTERADLLSLPGVSDYIASAVRCFAWAEPDPLVDTNTVRVAGRLFGFAIRDSSRRNADVRGLLAALVDPTEPVIYHYALLDLAAAICTKREPPACAQCPIRRFCLTGARV